MLTFTTSRVFQRDYIVPSTIAVSIWIRIIDTNIVVFLTFFRYEKDVSYKKIVSDYDHHQFFFYDDQSAYKIFPQMCVTVLWWSHAVS